MNAQRFINFAFLIILLSISVYSQTNSWRGLTPLISTRADVEKLLGKPQDPKFFNQYEVEGEVVSFTYQTKTCGGGWNIPKDFVLEIRVTFDKSTSKSFDELKLDKVMFNSIKTEFNGNEIWTNLNEGVQYYFNKFSNKLLLKFFIPKKSDYKYRCNGFPPFTPNAYYFTSVESGLSFYDFDKEEFEIIYNPIDALLNEVLSASDSIGYILVYFDKKLTFRAYRQRLEKIKKWIFIHRKFDSNRLKIIEGGMREKSEVQFFILHKDKIPPAPNPTLPSPQFMKKK